MKTIKTQNVSIPVELHDWVTKKMEGTKASTPWAKVTFSSVVEHALIELRNAEEQGKAASPEPVGVKTLKLSANLDTGSSKAGTGRSRKTG